MEEVIHPAIGCIVKLTTSMYYLLTARALAVACHTEARHFPWLVVAYFEYLECS